MKIDNDTMYGACPCGSGKKFKFCCWPKCRDNLADDMTNSEIVQTVRCTVAGVYDQPESPEVEEALDEGINAFKAGRFAKGRSLFNKARTLDPANWTAWNNEANAAWCEGDVEAAYEIQKRGLEVFSVRNAFGFASMAIYSHVLGRDDESAEWIDRALSGPPPLSRDMAVRVCFALAIFRRHGDIVSYVESSGMDDDRLLAFFKGTALANLGEMDKAKAALETAEYGSYGPTAEYYRDMIDDEEAPYSAYDGDWPYLCQGNFPPAGWFEDDLDNGRDPFARYPNSAVDAIEALIAEERRKPLEMLRLVEGKEGGRMAKLREGLWSLVDLEEAETDTDREVKDGPLPPGVKAVEDKEALQGFGPASHPAWLMEYAPDEDEEPEDDARAIVDGFLRPFAERHCSLGDCEEGDFEIALLQTQDDGDGSMGCCPSVRLGRHSQLWDMLKNRLEEFFACFSDNVYECRARYDQMFGGPILTLAPQYGGATEVFMVSLAERFDGEKNGRT